MGEFVKKKKPAPVSYVGQPVFNKYSYDYQA